MAWLETFPSRPCGCPVPKLPHDLSTEDMPDDTDCLKLLIDELQFENDLLRGVNGALRRHISRFNLWASTEGRLQAAEPFDIS